MARGITENDVHEAADALVAACERPTVERIRAYLGTGSPNTVTRWLDTWWGRLGNRLASQRATLALPDAPSEVVSLASRWWELALSVATNNAESVVAAETAHLDALRDQLAAQAELDRVGRETAMRQVHARGEQLAAWEQRAADWDVERTRMRSETERLAAVAALDREALDALRTTHATAQQHAEAERAAAAHHVRVVEDRAHQAVDVARQEAKALRAALTAATRDATRKDAILAKERAASARALAAAEREAITARTKAQTMEAALATFKASLRTQGRRISPEPASPRRAMPKRPVPSPSSKRP